MEQLRCKGSDGTRAWEQKARVSGRNFSKDLIRSRSRLRAQRSTGSTAATATARRCFCCMVFPETHVLWRKVAPTLSRDYFVVMTDLRGYGDSSKPPGGGDHFAYSKRAMAQDQVEVMR